jgi:hypothetical protein
LSFGVAVRCGIYCAIGLCWWTVFSGCTLTVDLDPLQDRHCPDGEKLCQDHCVSTKSPQFGCASTGCTPCFVPQATANCANKGQCGIAACLGDYHDCDLKPDNGCEVDLNHDPLHCGSCTALACVARNATPDCAAGRCAIRRCDTGFDDCNGVASDGCEVDLRSDPQHCASCETACPSGGTCANGLCS